MNHRSYPEIDLLLQDLLNEVRTALGDQFVGLYLYGSLATGDFTPRRSDVDFVVVTRDLLPENTIDALRRLHERLWSGANKWAQKLEGQYVPLSELRRHNPRGPALPTVNEGKFFMAGQGSDWVIQRYLLREHETIVAGPSLRSHIDPVSAQDVRSAILAVLGEWWAPMLDDGAWLDGRPDYQAFAVQTMCRIQYAAAFGKPGTKSAAASWAVAELDPQWRALIEEAAAWTEDQPPLGVERTLAFIRYTAQALLNGG
jgi:Aminoglycoside adenylyltransferase, C-terminal domain/Nucleotidyltransferase domain